VTMGELGYTEELNLWGEPRKLLGKYRGTVVDNIDLTHQGRLLVEATDALGLFPSNWAMPCVPIGGQQFGAYFVPPPGAGVWVEFEQGDPNKPIWTGFYAGSAADPPAISQLAAPGVPVMVMGTLGQASLSISDVPQTRQAGPWIMLQSGLSQLIVDTAGVHITAPLVEINGLPGGVDVNGGALHVT
jgi:Type VI secretion system/phage-baseplate injector OB domain